MLINKISGVSIILEIAERGCWKEFALVRGYRWSNGILKQINCDLENFVSAFPLTICSKWTFSGVLISEDLGKKNV